MNPLWAGWAYLLAAVVVGSIVGASRFIAEGRRRVLADRSHPLRIWERITAGRNP